MQNPWEEISLEDYESHMALGSVLQLQTLNRIIQIQMNQFPAESMMIAGIAGGNGLEHVDKTRWRKVYGVDVNKSYLHMAARRHARLGDTLECICLDLRGDIRTLPHAQLLIADLLVEYIGYDAFRKVIRTVRPDYVSCVIQKNENTTWVSGSPYASAFDHLDSVHEEIRANALIDVLQETDFSLSASTEYPLPNGKYLVQLDFLQDHASMQSFRE